MVAGSVPTHVELPEGETLIGRHPQCLLRLDNKTTSRRHAQITRQGDQVWVEDLDSAWGTLVNGQPIQQKTRLIAGDELVIGGVTIAYAVRFEPLVTGGEFVDSSFVLAQGDIAPAEVDGAPAQSITLSQKSLTFGRVPDRDVVPPDAMISRRHAVLEYQPGGYFLCDTQSQIGTFVNGKGVITM